MQPVTTQQSAPTFGQFRAAGARKKAMELCVCFVLLFDGLTVSLTQPMLSNIRRANVREDETPLLKRLTIHKLSVKILFTQRNTSHRFNNILQTLKHSQGSFGSYHTNRRVGAYCIRTDLEVFFLGASHHVLIVHEKPQANLFLYLVSFVPYLVTSALIPSTCSETISRVRPVCLQRDAGGLS